MNGTQMNEDNNRTWMQEDAYICWIKRTKGSFKWPSQSRGSCTSCQQQQSSINKHAGSQVHCIFNVCVLMMTTTSRYMDDDHHHDAMAV